MLRRLPAADVQEPLASAAPAEFYFLRARNFDALQILVDEADRFITPAVRLLQQRHTHQFLNERYRLELGLPSDGLSRLLGPSLVQSLALVGSDAFLRQGSDLTTSPKRPTSAPNDKPRNSPSNWRPLVPAAR